MDSYSDIIADCMLNLMNSKIREDFKEFLLNNGDKEWLIVTDYHMIDSSIYENYVAVFTILPGSNHFIDIETINKGLPKKLSQSKVTQSDLDFLKNLNHFTFAFIGEKDFRAAAPTAKDAKASIDASLKNMRKWKNADECSEVIKFVQRYRQDANGSGFNLKLHNQMTLTAATISAISLFIAKTLPLDVVYWFSDRDAIVSNFNSMVYTMVNLNLQSFAQKEKLREFYFVWPLDDAIPNASGKLKALPMEPYIRIPDHFAAPIASSNFSAIDVQFLDKEKYQRILENVAADSSNIVILRLENEQGWTLQGYSISLNPSMSSIVE